MQSTLYLRRCTIEDWIKPTVDFIVETNEEGVTEVTYNRMNLEAMFHLAVWMVGFISYHTGLPYNQVLEDMKEEIETKGEDDGEV